MSALLHRLPLPDPVAGVPGDVATGWAVAFGPV